MSTEQPSPEPLGTKPRRRKRSGAFWGLVLILVGAFIFSQQAGLIGEQFNWWAIFIFIGAVGSFSTAFNAYQNSGKFDAAVRSSLGGGIVILTVALMFLFGLDWSIYWPYMVIAGGVSFFLNGLGGTGTGPAGGLITASLWLGLGAIYLGLGFLAINLNWMDPQAYFGQYQWWAVAILIPGLGAFINALIVSASSGGFNRTAFALVVFGLLVSATGVVALFGISWNYLGPILLIVLGITIMLGIFSRKK
jgi:hypothetical protein